MNIESLLNKIELFDELVIRSGFTRDINDYINAIQQSQNQNLVFMRDISAKIQLAFEKFNNNSLPSELVKVVKDNPPFTSYKFDEQLRNLDANQTIDGGSYFNELNSILANLSGTVSQNTDEIRQVKDMLLKYSSQKPQNQTDEEKALVSLIFKDLSSTGTLKQFSLVLNRWNRTLLVLHQLLKSESPKDISLAGIQNGSIDVIFNIDFDIAIDLTELIKTGLKVYAAYLIYKSKTARELVASYSGNRELLELEAKREVLMLDNIKTSVKEKAIQLHTSRVSVDPNIDSTAIDAKAEEVSSVITDHIIKGNEIKLLNSPKSETMEENTGKKISIELREATALVNERYKELSTDDKQILLEKYSIEDNPQE